MGETCALCSQAGLSRRRMLAGLAGAGAAAGLGALAAGCATNPVTGRNQLILVDDGQLQQMSVQAWAQERQRNRVWDNAAQQARLQRVGLNIARFAQIPNAQWEFVIFDSPEKNAYVLPGGKVGFYRGLIEICDRDDHIATVLGHEVGHVVARHAAERYSRAMAEQGVMSVAGAAVNSTIAQQALGLGLQLGVALPFSRAQESEADIVGIDLMHAAGYDVRQSIVFWQRMEQAGGQRPPAFLSTHPEPAGRIAGIRAHINARGWGPV
ncbi:MAG: M48 family metallopeptidase [Hyphomonadaceae bacterium]